MRLPAPAQQGDFADELGNNKRSPPQVMCAVSLLPQIVKDRSLDLGVTWQTTSTSARVTEQPSAAGSTYLHGLGAAVGNVRGAQVDRQLLDAALVVHVHVDAHKAVLRRVGQQRDVLHLRHTTPSGG